MVLAGIAALVTLTWLTAGPQLSEVIHRAWCRLEGCSVAAAASTVDPWDSPNPVRRATWGDIVILGDSFASGEGNDHYGTLGSKDRCHASETAYGRAVSSTFGLDGRASMMACSGAVVSDLTKRRRGHSPQFNALTPATSLVTVTIGGNDLKWTEVMKRCAAVPTSCRAGSDLDRVVRRSIEAIGPVLRRTFSDARRRAPHARIIATSYPRFFPAQPREDYTQLFGQVTVFDRDTQAWTNERFEQFNAVIRDAATSVGVEFVDLSDAFEGHELTSDDPWYHGIEYRIGANPFEAATFHPNAGGQARMADLVEAQIRRPVR